MAEKRKALDHADSSVAGDDQRAEGLSHAGPELKRLKVESAAASVALAFRLKCAEAVRTGTKLLVQANPVSIVSKLIASSERRPTYAALLKSLPKGALPVEMLRYFLSIGFRGSPYLIRTASTSAGHRPGDERGTKRRTNGHTAQDILLPAAASRPGQILRNMLDTPLCDVIYWLFNHLIWKDLKSDHWLSFSRDWNFCFVHALNRHSEEQGLVTIQIIDRRACIDMDGRSVPFWYALDVVKKLDIYNKAYTWDHHVEGELHPRKFTHEYITWGPVIHQNATLLQASLPDMIADGLYELVPHFKTPEGYGREGLYHSQALAMLPTLAFLPSTRIPTAPFETPLTVEKVLLARKIALRAGTKQKVVPGETPQPHLFAFLGLLTLQKRPRRDPLLMRYIARYYAPHDVKDIYLQPNGTVYDGFTEVAENLPSVMQGLDLLRDCIEVFNLPPLPVNVEETSCSGKNQRLEDDRLNSSTIMFWSIEQDQKDRKAKHERKEEKKMVLVDAQTQQVLGAVTLQSDGAEIDWDVEDDQDGYAGYSDGQPRSQQLQLGDSMSSALL